MPTAGPQRIVNFMDKCTTVFKDQVHCYFNTTILPNAKKNMIKDTKSASMMQNQKLHFLYKVD